jgi:hypothetical protein
MVFRATTAVPRVIWYEEGHVAITNDYVALVLDITLDPFTRN